jgi:hypothetical protein
MWRGGGGAIWRQGKEEVAVEPLLRDKHNYSGQGSPWSIPMVTAFISVAVGLSLDTGYPQHCSNGGKRGRNVNWPVSI